MIYPKLGKAENPFLGKAIEELPLEKEETAWDFYRFAVPLPTLGEEHGGKGRLCTNMLPLCYYVKGGASAYATSQLRGMLPSRHH